MNENKFHSMMNSSPINELTNNPNQVESRSVAPEEGQSQFPFNYWHETKENQDNSKIPLTIGKSKKK